MNVKTVAPPKIGFVSLGCPKALVDSERILTQLRTDGYEIVPEYAEAELVVVNTCGFIDEAKAESLESIGEAIQENGKVIVTGCLGAREQEIRSRYPQVLNVSGPQQYEQVVKAVHEFVPFQSEYDPFKDLVPPQGIKLTPRHYAYLKISEGCNHKCRFCIIPSMRGHLVSRPLEEVMREAESLVNAGVKELLVISQDTSAYGTDIKYKTGFWQGRPVKSCLTGLCESMAQLGIWIRLHYVYPYPHVDEVIPLMGEGKILPYLDIPFQHASTQILKSMRRPAAAENTLKRIRHWRDICPELVIRSTFIVGFPGETENDFEALLDFLEAAQLDRVGCFKYSPVEGAAANDLPNPLPEGVKEERWHKLMQVQQSISRKRLEMRIGQTLSVLVDESKLDGGLGRSYADSPEIDGQVHIVSKKPLHPGDLVEVRITEAGDYDLKGHQL